MKEITPILKKKKRNWKKIKANKNCTKRSIKKSKE